MRHLGFTISLLVLSACGQGAEQCTDWAGSNIGAGWGQCGDTKDRNVECELGAAGQPSTCVCKVGDQAGTTFQQADTSVWMTLETATATANEKCGWHLSR